MFNKLLLNKNKNKNFKTDKSSENRKKILNKDTRFDIKEAYNELRTNIKFSMPGIESKVISITSSVASEGKSTTCLNNAISFADIYGKTIVIDCDLRRPNIDRLLNIKDKKGLSNILVGDIDFKSSIIKTQYKNLDVITSGNIPPNPTELLSSDIMGELIEELKKEYKYIFLDTPPINIVIDASILVKYVDGVVVVVRQQTAEKRLLNESIKKLNFANAKILGFVLNGVPSKSKSYSKGKYGKYGYYKSYSADE